MTYKMIGRDIFKLNTKEIKPKVQRDMYIILKLMKRSGIIKITMGGR